MTVDAWLELAVADTERRGLPDMRPLLEGLAQATRLLRRAACNADARGTTGLPHLPLPGRADVVR
jgi:hypothetical protein